MRRVWGSEPAPAPVPETHWRRNRNQQGASWAHLQHSDLIHPLKGGQHDFGGKGSDVHRVFPDNSGDSHAGVDDSHVGILSRREVGLLRGCSVPGCAQCAVGNQADIAIGDKGSGGTALIPVHPVIEGDLEAGGIFDHSAHLVVGEEGSGRAAGGEEPLFEGVGFSHQIKGVGVHNGGSDFGTGAGTDGVHSGFEVQEGVRGGGIGPRRIAFQGEVIAAFPGSVRVVLVGIIGAVGFYGDSHIAVRGEEELTDHAFRDDVCGSDQVVHAVKDMFHHCLRIGVAGVSGAEQLLTVPFG